MKSLTRLTTHALLVLAGALPAAADGFMVVRPTPELPHPEQLAVRYHDVDITIGDQVGHVVIDQVFRNLNGRQVAGDYIFPIPDGAAVSDFVLYVDGEPVHAEAMDADRARRVYEELVRENRDPALLEYAGREMFRARVYPFAPHGERRVALEYDHLVERQGGLYRFVYPLSTEKFSSRPLESAYVKIDLRTDHPIRNAYCPSHDVDIEYLGSRHLRLTWEESGTKPDRDLVFYYSLAEGAMDLRLVPYRPDRGADGYFMLLASMGADDDIPVAPKDVVFVIDRSGSMRGEKIEQARKALVYCLRNLNREDRFNVISFASDVGGHAADLSRATRRQVGDAVEYVRSLEAGGGTHIAGALERALDADFGAARPGFVVFLTDGLPTEGERDPERILRRVLEQNERRGSRRRRMPGVRIFPFGVGYDVNAVLLDQLAVENGGAPSYVRPGENLEDRVTAFYDQVANPVMSDIEIDVSGVRFRDIEPGVLPDLFRGGQLVLFGRYRGSGKATVTLSGRVGGERIEFATKIRLPKRERGNEFVGRLWATRRVGSLLRRIRLYGEEGEWVAEVKDLGLSFGVVTPYTSFLVDEDARERNGWLADLGASVHMGMKKLGGGRDAAAPAPQDAALTLQATSGRVAFEVSREVEELARAKSESKAGMARGLRRLAGRTYQLEGEVWKDVACPAEAKPTEIELGSKKYFALLEAHPELGPVFALGDEVIFQIEGRWYAISSGK